MTHNKGMETKEVTRVPPKTVFVGVIFDSEDVAKEVVRYLKVTNQVRGRAYAQAIVEKMERERKEGRYV